MIQLILNLDEVNDNTEVSISKLISWGIKHCEIRMINGKNISYLTENDCLKLKSEFEKVSLQPYLITSPIFKWNFDNGSKDYNLNEIDSFGVSPLLSDFEKKQIIKNVISNAKILNVKNIRIFSGTNCTLEEFLQSEELTRLVTKNPDYYFLIENERSCALKNLSDFFICQTFIEENNIKNMGFLLDMGNIFLSDKMFKIQNISKIKKYVQHIQFKNFRMKNNVIKFTSLEKGVINYRYVFQEILKIFEQENVNIGIETDIWHPKLRYRTMKESVNYLNDILEGN